APMVIAEEHSELWIGDVGVNGQSIEVVRQIEAGHRETEFVFGAHPEVFQEPRVSRKEVRESCRVDVWGSGVVLRCIQARIRKTVAVFDNGQNLKISIWDIQPPP